MSYISTPVYSGMTLSSAVHNRSPASCSPTTEYPVRAWSNIQNQRYNYFDNVPPRKIAAALETTVETRREYLKHVFEKKPERPVRSFHPGKWAFSEERCAIGVLDGLSVVCSLRPWLHSNRLAHPRSSPHERHKRAEG